MADSTVPIEAELTLFRPKLHKLPRRGAERYRCALASAGKLFFPATGETMSAWLNNLSTTGIGLNLTRELEPGSALVIQVRVEGKIETVKLPAKVVHSTLEVDGSWRIGCNFDAPLTADALEALL